MSVGAVAPGRSGGPRGIALGSCERPLCAAYDASLYDLDGVLYLGLEPVRHAAESVRAASRAGMRSAFVTNNASRRPAAVAAHLKQLGIAAEAADVVTSAQASVRLLRERLPPGAPVLTVGAPGLADEIAAGGYSVVHTASQDVQAVVQGYGPDTGMRELSEAALAVRAGALWIACNTDSTLPSPRGQVPGNGALVAALRVATGREPLVAGKPAPALHLESVARVGAARPLVVGDRLDTDVLGAVRGSADSLLVLTGVVDVGDLLSAPVGMRPTYVAWDLRGLLAPQPPVDVGPTGAGCGSSRASYVDGRIRVQGMGVTALRAACALAWSCGDGGAVVAGIDGLQE